MDEEWHRELLRTEAAGRRDLTLATWIPLSVSVAIMLYFAWYLGNMRGRIEAGQECLGMMNEALGRGGESARPPHGEGPGSAPLNDPRKERPSGATRTLEGRPRPRPFGGEGPVRPGQPGGREDPTPP